MMKMVWATVVGLGVLGWWWKAKSSLKLGSLEGVLGLAGLGTLLFGVSFVQGAIEEREPEAARAGSNVFGRIGLGLLLLAGLIGWARRR